MTKTPDAAAPTTPVRWDPFREMQLVRDRLDALLGDSLGSAGFTPLADIEETEDAWIVDVELPGVQKGDLDLELQGRRLVLSGTRKERERTGVLRHKTRVTGEFRYEITLPSDFDGDKIDARLADGELTVRVPKSTRDEPRRIAIG